METQIRRALVQRGRASREREKVLEPEGRDQRVIGRLETSARGKGRPMRVGAAVVLDLRLEVRTGTMRPGGSV